MSPAPFRRWIVAPGGTDSVQRNAWSVPPREHAVIRIDASKAPVRLIELVLRIRFTRVLRSEEIRARRREGYRSWRLWPLLPFPQLDVALHRFELDPGTARLPDVRAQVFGIEPPAHRHLEVRVERAVDGLQLDVGAEITRELDAHASIDRRELHVIVRVHLADACPNAA